MCFTQPINKEKEDCVYPTNFRFYGSINPIKLNVTILLKDEENPLFYSHLRLSTSFQPPLEDKQPLLLLSTVLS